VKAARPCPEWRRVAWRGQAKYRYISSEEGFRGRCPPCLLGHRRVARRFASPKRHKDLGQATSQPARRAREPDTTPARARRTSALTNGSWKSSISGTWLTPVPSTGPGGASSPTISRRWATEQRPAPSRSSRPPRARGPPRAGRLDRGPFSPRRPRRRHPDRATPRPLRHRKPARLPRPRQPRRPLRPLRRARPRRLRRLRRARPRRLRFLRRARPRRLRRAKLCPLPQAQPCFLPRAHPKGPRSAGCAVPRPGRSPT
jgi:hypothetical protein